MRISDWSSDVCSSDLHDRGGPRVAHRLQDLHGVVGGHDPSRVIITYELANSVVAAAFETSCANWNVGTPDPSTTRVSMPRFVVNVVRGFELARKSFVEGERGLGGVGRGGGSINNKINTGKHILTTS